MDNNIKEGLDTIKDIAQNVVLNTSMLGAKIASNTASVQVEYYKENADTINNITKEIVLISPPMLGARIVYDVYNMSESTREYLHERYTHEGLKIKEQNSSDKSIKHIYEHEIFTSFDEDDKKKLHLDALALSQNIYVINGHDKNFYKTYSKSNTSSEESNIGWYLLSPNSNYIPNNHPNEIDNFVTQINRKKLCFNSFGRKDTNGLGSALFYSKYKKNLFIFAYVTEGSNLEANDWIHANFKQGAGLKSEQYDNSIRNAEQIAKTFESVFGKNNPKYKLFFFGHSLGGGLANANALATGYPSITFNAAALNSDYAIEYQKNYEKRIMVGEYADGEILSVGFTKMLGLHKDGDRYKTELSKNKNTVTNLIGNHFLAPLCQVYHLEKMNFTDWNKTEPI